MPVIKPIAGHTSVRGVSDYLQKDGRALAVDLYNLSWDEDRDAELDPDLKQDVDWAAEMDLTRIANGNDTPWRGKRARTYMHFIVSPDPKDKVTLSQLRELTRAWVRGFGRHSPTPRRRSVPIPPYGARRRPGVARLRPPPKRRRTP